MFRGRYVDVSSGPGRLMGVGNGDSRSPEVQTGPEFAFFNGRAQAIVRSEDQPGTIGITVESDGLEFGRASVQSC